MINIKILLEFDLSTGEALCLSHVSLALLMLSLACGFNPSVTFKAAVEFVNSVFFFNPYPRAHFVEQEGSTT